MNKLIFPQEIEVWYILPIIRKKIALKLIQNNLSQKKVAQIMSLTEAAVSQYKKQKRGKQKIGTEDLFDATMEKELEKSVSKIIKAPLSLSNEIIHLSKTIKKSGLVCKIYKKMCALNKNKIQCPYCRG